MQRRVRNARFELSSLLIPVFAVIACLGPVASAAGRPMSVEDLLRLQRISDPQISPDGRHVLYAVATTNLDANGFDSNIWIVSTAGTPSRQLTYSGKDRSARWSPDGKLIAFLSRRDGKSQVYVLPVEGGEAQALTKTWMDMETLRWSPDGATLVASAAVFPGCGDDACNKSSEEKRARASNARVYDAWPYSRAMSWVDGRRSHLFAVAISPPATPRDLTPGWPHDILPGTATEGSPDVRDVAISPDGKEVAFASTEQIEPNGQMITHLYNVPMAGGEPQRLTQAPGIEKGPVYSPDGRVVAYRWNPDGSNSGGQSHVMSYDRESRNSTDLTAKLDRGASALEWAADGKTLLFLAEQDIGQPIFAVSGDGGAAREITAGFTAEFSAASASSAIALARTSMSAPAEIFVIAKPGAAPRQITHHNDALLAEFDLPAPEPFWFISKDGIEVQAILLRPPGMPAGRKVPLVVLLHGGPHTTWSDAWSYRWNPQLFAAPGRAVLIVNRRGSSGYGQKFSDGVIADWGGAAYDDVMSGLDAALERYPFLDGARVAAAGASYGGYMANWIATHSSRFKAIVSHAGVFDMFAQYGTDFPFVLEQEMRGLPWSAESFAKWSPASYAAALGLYRTPMLVTTGEKDYRVPYQQSLALFAALQRQSVQSKLLVFPDAGHWILKPKDIQLWNTTVQEWLQTYL
ncbi:MAG: Prolyl tripeptidyl peptidase precursor [Pseudomonadota bacterium]|jgi:dipeptidyl aminopeptidase/acylaminoacyl peptidase